MTEIIFIAINLSNLYGYVYKIYTSWASEGSIMEKKREDPVLNSVEHHTEYNYCNLSYLQKLVSLLNRNQLGSFYKCILHSSTTFMTAIECSCLRPF